MSQETPVMIPSLDKIMQRSDFLVESIGHEDYVGVFTGQINPEFNIFSESWDSTCSYRKILDILYSTFSLSDQNFVKIVMELKEKPFCKNFKIPDIPGDFSHDIEFHEHPPIIDELAKYFMDTKIASGFKVAEIGGSITGIVSSLLGSSNNSVNAGFKESHGQFYSIEDSISEEDKIVDLENYQRFFDGAYDLTVSSALFDKYSGFESVFERRGFMDGNEDSHESSINLHLNLFIDKYGVRLKKNEFLEMSKDLDLFIANNEFKTENISRENFRADVDAVLQTINDEKYADLQLCSAVELLAVYSNLTKKGGYSIHGGFYTEVKDDVFSYFGLKKVLQEEFEDARNLVIFEKVDPDINKFPNGLKLTMDYKIVYDNNNDIFYFSNQ